MGDIKLLDCTLRDGGYINDWNFGHDNLVSVFERSVEAGIDIIEIGFLDERRPFDINRSIMPDTDCVEKIYGGLDRKQAIVVGMIDFGTCGLEHIKPCEECFLDGIRVIFKKHLRKQAMEFCGQLKKLGYKVFAQLVSVTSYSDGEMLDLVQLANEVKPYAVSMVDTYGLMHQDNLMHFFDLLNDNLAPEIGLGYHAHNNFQMGYANCIAMLANKIERNMVVDGAIYGMGKSAGNAPIELIAMHLNNKYGRCYNISQILEAIDSNISQFFTAPAWGYSMFYYMAASNDCHPNYVTYLMQKRTLSVKSINDILGSLEGEKKLLFDKEYIEKLYSQYQDREINDSGDIGELSRLFADRNILLVGPGRSMLREMSKILDYIEKNKPLIISINYIPDYIKPDHIFLSNSKRYVQLAGALARGKYSIIATSNVTCTNGSFDYMLNVSRLLDREAEIIDNSLVMLVKALAGMGVRSAVLAGFDGYSRSENSYFCEKMEYDFSRRMADYLNDYTINFINEYSDRITLKFLTESKYTSEVI